MQFRRLGLAALAAGLLGAAAMPAAAADGDSSGFIFQPEAVYFTFTENNFNYATVGPYDAYDVDGDHQRLDNDYDFGYRLGLGYRWDNNWDFMFRYTHIDSQAKDDVQATGGDYLWLDQDAAAYDEYFYEGYAQADSDQQLDYIDLTVGRSFESANGTFFGHAQAGIRWARFDQDFNALYIDNSDDTPDTDDDTFSSWQRSSYSGWGVTLGGEGHIRLGNESDWSLYGGLNASILMGHTKQSRRDSDWYYEDYPNVGDEYYEVINTTDSFDSTSMVVDAQVGVEWAHQYDNVMASVRFGWEIQHWGGIGTLASYSEAYEDSSARDDRNGDIGLSGGFVRAGWAW